ncbi:MAG: ArsR family transcriptional regulator [Hyphomicrobiaceae bacterium]|jgi:ArsR family transcriptional regulator, arsenate/arsenite/antimonite-responsive transcriptional repressor
MKDDPTHTTNISLELVEAAQGFAAIGSEPRLEVLLALVRAGPGGLNVGDIQKRLDMPASTLTHHLRFLAAAGLIEQTKDGRSIRNLAAFERIEELAAYLLRECCVDQSGSTPVGGSHDHAR